MTDENAIHALKNAWNGAVATADRLRELAPAVASFDESTPIASDSLGTLHTVAAAHALAAQALRGLIEALQSKADQPT